MGIADATGTLEPGKMADGVLWNGNPFSVYAHAEKVYIDGARVYDRDDPARQPESDLMLGRDEGRGRAGGVARGREARAPSSLAPRRSWPDRKSTRATSRP